MKFSVKATGNCLCFQWQENCIDLKDVGRYRTTTTDTLHIVKVKKSDHEARYRCRVINDEKKEQFSEEAILFTSKHMVITKNGC